MKKVLWRIIYTELPTITRHCAKCGRDEEFICSGKFRVNAQQRSLDIWLIYRCAKCDSTWNARVFNHVPPQSLAPETLHNFTDNDAELARSYAMNCEFLRSNGAAVNAPPYEIAGEYFDPDEPTELTIRSEASFAPRVSSIIRKRLCMGQAEFNRRVDAGLISCAQTRKLKNCRLAGAITVRFGH